MKAFHNDKTIKAKYLARVRAHRKADAIVKGQYWKNGKGCAVGCTIEGSEHARYETELGIPEWLASIEDRLFEGMPNEKAQRWPVEFLKAINVGADLNKIKIPFLIAIIEQARTSTKNELTLNYIDGVLEVLKAPGELDLVRLRVARQQSRLNYAAAAYAAAYAADADADAAAAAAAAAGGAAAAAAAYAADADAAAAYAADAAREQTYLTLARKLLELMKACK